MEKPWTGKNFKLGMLGGGQLGRMFIQNALNYDVHVHCLDPNSEAPCALIASSFTVGSLTDFDTVYAFGQDKNILTIEIENVNIEALKKLQSEGKKIFPQPESIEIIQDKGFQKQFYLQNNLPTSDFQLIENKADLISKNLAFPYVLKLRKGGYDGKGVQIIRSLNDLETCFDTPCIAEPLIPFVKELSVIVARNETGETAAYPSVECEFNSEANLVEFLFSPAEIPLKTEIKAKEIALQTIRDLGMIGILAVEFFLTENGDLLINEIAPRPHNSGHQTIECNETSQFEQHLRSVLDLPLGSCELLRPGVMINLLGEQGFSGDAFYEGLTEAMKHKGVKVHLYGKQSTNSFRKMGHVTICNENLSYCKELGKLLSSTIKIKTKD